MSGDNKGVGGVLLQVNNISLKFGAVEALSDISFKVLEHEFLAIIVRVKNLIINHNYVTLA